MITRMYTRLDIPLPAQDEGYHYASRHGDQIEQGLQSLRDTYQDWVEADTVPSLEAASLLGSGYYADCYGAGDIAIRTPRNQKMHALRYAENMVRGVGVPSLEQVLALGDNRLYSGKLEGVKRPHIRAKMLGAVALDDIDRYLDVFTIMQSRGLALDFVGDNILCDVHSQISFIDYFVDPAQRVEHKVWYLTAFIGEAGLKQTRMERPKLLAKEVAGRREPLDTLCRGLQRRAAEAPLFWGASMAAYNQRVDMINREWAQR